jgi:anti-sigma regulatory factor (Ser/Thr protein kinase)
VVLGMETYLRLPPEPRSVRQAREHVRHTLAEAGRADWVDDATVAVSELVTNVVLHAGTACELLVSVSVDSARVSVRDFSAALPIERHYSSQATTGRGLTIVARLSADFGVDSLGHAGKVVWFELDDSVGDAATPDR